jgi:hypothetical protein
MDNKKDEPAPSPEIIPDHSDEVTIRIEALIESLDFHEPIQLKLAAEVVVGALEDGDESAQQQAWLEYSVLLEHIVDKESGRSLDPKAYPRIRIAALIHKALIFYKVKDMTHFVDELDQAQEYAFGEHLDELNQALHTELEVAIAHMGISPEVVLIKLKGIISEDRLRKLRDLLREGSQLNDMIAGHYDMLLVDDDTSIDKILAALGIEDS